LGKVIAMLEEERPCLEAAQQLQAVQQHIEECLDDSLLEESGDVKERLAEFKEITKYL